MLGARGSSKLESFELLDIDHLLDAPVHDIANAAPFLFEREALERAADRIVELAAVEPNK